ncbi:hypothetical protein BJV74DRAFT_953641 [Russula compacta]|nr:hypothetical protein BJV74DRAFT_953641 [Russula compacta]
MALLFVVIRGHYLSREVVSGARQRIKQDEVGRLIYTIHHLTTNTAQQYCDTIMLVLASVVSFLATLSLALSADGVDKTNTSYQEQLALTTNGTLTPITLSADEVLQSSDTIIAMYFSMQDGGIIAYGPNDSVVAVSGTIGSGNSPVPFILTNNPPVIPSAQEYCMLFDTGPEGVQFPDELAVHGNSEDFAICHILDGAPVLIYEADGLNRKSVGFVLQDCHEVHVYMLLVKPQ